MPQHAFDIPVDLPSRQVFDYLAKGTNLRDCFPEQLRPGVPLGMGSDDVRQRIEWTADDGGRGGSMAVADNGPAACVVRVEMHGDGVDDAALQKNSEQVVGTLAQQALAQDDTEHGGRS